MVPNKSVKFAFNPKIRLAKARNRFLSAFSKSFFSLSVQLDSTLSVIYVSTRDSIALALSDLVLSCSFTISKIECNASSDVALNI